MLLHSLNELNQDVSMQALFELNRSVFVRLGFGVYFMLMLMEVELSGFLMNQAALCLDIGKLPVKTIVYYDRIANHLEKPASTPENCLFVCLCV